MQMIWIASILRTEWVTNRWNGSPVFVLFISLTHRWDRDGHPK